MECLIIILVVSMIYFIFPSRKDTWDGSDIDGGTYGVADFNYQTPAGLFPYDEVVKKKSRKKTDKSKPLPKNVKKKKTKKRTTKKKW